jgi:hypothetical protein
MTKTLIVATVLQLSVIRPSAATSDAVTAGEFLVDPPTLINLGFEWFIDGDDNRNAAVEVSYRKQGETQWKRALPMLRITASGSTTARSWTS